MTKASDNVFPRFLVSEGGSTTTPAADTVTVYAKADGLLYSKDDAGAETLLSGGVVPAAITEITDIPTADTTATNVLAPDGAGGVEWRAEVGAAEITDIPTSDTTATNVLAPDGAGGVEWRAEAGGGSATVGDGKRYVIDPPSSAATEDDEFNDGTSMSGPVNGLDAKWSKHNLGTAGWTILSDAVAPGCLYFDIATGQSAPQYIYQTVPSGDWTVAARASVHYVEGRMMFGIVCVDSSGTGISACLDTGGTWGLRTLSSWGDGSGGTFSSRANIAIDYANYDREAVPVNVTLRKASGVYHVAWSWSDRLLPGAYTEVISHTPSAFTPAYIGFGRIYGGGKDQFLLDFFRKVA